MTLLKKMSSVCLLLLLPSVVAFAMNWHWSQAYLTSFSSYWVAITQTAGEPIAIVTSIVFFLLFIIILKIRHWSRLWRLALIIGTALILGQGIKFVVKNCSAKPRPYVLWLEEIGFVNHTTFYSVDKKIRKSLLSSIENKMPTHSKQVVSHWRQETNYSFPSGHTLFAATWAFLAIIFLRFYVHYVVITVMIVWSLIIEISRLVLGVHDPSDIAASVIIAFLICLGVCFCARRMHIVE